MKSNQENEHKYFETAEFGRHISYTSSDTIVASELNLLHTNLLHIPIKNKSFGNGNFGQKS